MTDETFEVCERRLLASVDGSVTVSRGKFNNIGLEACPLKNLISGHWTLLSIVVLQGDL